MLRPQLHANALTVVKVSDLLGEVSDLLRLYRKARLDAGRASTDSRLALDLVPDVSLGEETERPNHVEPHQDQDQCGERTLEAPPWRRTVPADPGDRPEFPELKGHTMPITDQNAPTKIEVIP